MIDFIILYACDDILVFHNVLLFQDIMHLKGKTVSAIDLRNFNPEIHTARNIIFYRTETIYNEAIIKLNPLIKTGYMIDDNIFYEGNDDCVPELYRKNIRENCISKADYCLTWSLELTKELLKINKNSFCLGNPPLWEYRYAKHNIPAPSFLKNEIFTIGVISGMGHDREIQNHLITIAEAVKDVAIKVIYFSQSPILNVQNNIRLEHHNFISCNNNMDWYIKLHSLNFDFVYAEYFKSFLTYGKSDLKFRECAYMKIPLVALDPTQKVYSDIINGENGYSVASKSEAIDSMRKLIISPSLCRKMGENAYTTLLDRDPVITADKIINIFEKINLKVN